MENPTTSRQHAARAYREAQQAPLVRIGQGEHQRDITPFADGEASVMRCLLWTCVFGCAVLMLAAYGAWSLVRGLIGA